MNEGIIWWRQRGGTSVSAVATPANSVVNKYASPSNVTNITISSSKLMMRLSVCLSPDSTISESNPKSKSLVQILIQAANHFTIPPSKMYLLQIHMFFYITIKLHGVESLKICESLSWPITFPLLKNAKVQYRICKNTPLLTFLSQTNPVYILTHYLFKIHCNIILPSAGRFFK
jgi:hypothetical protein